MNQFEMSAVLYYADFLSLQYQNKPCTEQCKYFFIHGVPVNIAYKMMEASEFIGLAEPDKTTTIKEISTIMQEQESLKTLQVSGSAL